MNTKISLKFVPITIIILQMVTSVGYIIPATSHAHIPDGFIKMLIFGGTTLVILAIITILYFIYKPSGLLWKIPFIISFVMILLAWFY